EQNTRVQAVRLAAKGIRVTGITTAVLGSPGVGAAMLRGGACGLGDSPGAEPRPAGRAGPAAYALIRTPMLSQAGRVVDVADVSVNTEAAVVRTLDRAASRTGRTHGIALMVEFVERIEALHGISLDVVSGGNSANLNWAPEHRRRRQDRRTPARRSHPPPRRSAVPACTRMPSPRPPRSSRSR
ncbi:MAG: hypothetical protein L0I24_04630, partial [Pseudonocardia sp.]|nr:hypothetical protein [Pseudonocardia sp.]